MATTLDIKHQRIDDLPLLIARLVEMEVAQQIDQPIQVHGRWQGISVGTIVLIWLCYSLTEHEHRLGVVREWAAQRRERCNRLLGMEWRETDWTADRLAKVGSRLGEPAHPTAWDQGWVQTWGTRYELPTAGPRQDSTRVRASVAWGMGIAKTPARTWRSARCCWPPWTRGGCR